MLQISLYIEATFDLDGGKMRKDRSVLKNLHFFFSKKGGEGFKGCMEIHPFWESGAPLGHVKF